MVPPLRRVTFSKSRKSNQKDPAPGLALLRRVPSLRRRSVGPRRTDIHVLAALSRHPCRSTHSAPPAFGLHPSRVRRRLYGRGTRATAGAELRLFALHTFAGYTRSNVGAAGGTTAAKRCIRQIVYHRSSAIVAVVPAAAPTFDRVYPTNVRSAKRRSSAPAVALLPRLHRHRRTRLGCRLKSGPNQEPAFLVTFGWAGIPGVCQK